MKMTPFSTNPFIFSSNKKRAFHWFLLGWLFLFITWAPLAPAQNPEDAIGKALLNQLGPTYYQKWVKHIDTQPVPDPDFGRASDPYPGWRKPSYLQYHYRVQIPEANNWIRDIKTVLDVSVPSPPRDKNTLLPPNSSGQVTGPVLPMGFLDFPDCQNHPEYCQVRPFSEAKAALKSLNGSDNWQIRFLLRGERFWWSCRPSAPFYLEGARVDSLLLNPSDLNPQCIFTQEHRALSFLQNKDIEIVLDTVDNQHNPFQWPCKQLEITFFNASDSPLLLKSVLNQRIYYGGGKESPLVQIPAQTACTLRVSGYVACGIDGALVDGKWTDLQLQGPPGRQPKGPYGSFLIFIDKGKEIWVKL